MTGDCLSENEVLDFVNGRASPARRAEIESHLDTCDACVGVVAGTAALQDQEREPTPLPASKVSMAARVLGVALLAVAALGAILLVLRTATPDNEPFPRSLSVLRDPAGDLTAQAAAARPESSFRPVRTEHANFGLTRDALWLRLVLENPKDTAQELVLDATREWVDDVDFFEVAGSDVTPLGHSGAQVPLARRPIATERIAFPLLMPARTTKIFLIRMRGRSPLSFRGGISTRRAFAQQEAADQILFGAFYAVLWGLAAYSLILFVALRDRIQLAVGILLGAYGLAEATSHGHVSRVFPFGAGWFELRGGAAAFSLVIATVLSLARAVLKLPESSRLDRGTRIATWVLAGVCAVPVFFPALHFLVFVALLGFCLMTLAIIYLSARRDRATLFFFLAVGSLVVPGTVTLAVLFGALPAFPIVEYGNHVGAVAMSCLFSLLVADAIRQQREKIGTLNQQLAAGYEELRFQVAARSRELVNLLAKTAGHTAIGEVHPGDVFEQRYRILRHLGDGGWGRVYEVKRLSDDRPLALKIVTRTRSGAEAARVAREAEIGARLHHPNLVSIVDVGVAAGGSPFLVMELVDGGSLEDQRSRFGDVAWGLPLLGGIARGLRELHRARIVHRDLKPANVLLEGRETTTAKVADFGIARVDSLGGDSEDVDAFAVTEMASPIGPAAALTHAGAVVGTPAYMAPEAARGARFVGPKADVFAFGVIACEVLVGPTAFEGSLIRASGVSVAARSLARLDLPAGLGSVLELCLALDPRARPSIDDVASAFADVATRGRDRPETRNPAASSRIKGPPES